MNFGISYSNNNNDNNNDYNDIIFLKLWRNIVINRVIFSYVALYKKNKCVVFEDRRSLRLYGEKEYITKLTFVNHLNSSQDILRKGDLPNENGVLKLVDLSFCTQIESSDIFPQNVETIHFNGKDQIVLSKLPSSVTTITNVLLKKPFSDNQIPSNITSIGFCDKIDPIEFNSIIFPNTIKRLVLNHRFSELPGIISAKTFFPSSVTELTIHYSGDSESAHLPYIPSSVTKLYVDISRGGKWSFKNNFIPFGVKELTIYSVDVIKLLPKCLPESITKLSIYNCNGKMGSRDIKAKSIPKSVLDLTIIYNDYHNKSFKDIFPNGLERLITGSKFKLSEAPSTLKYLKIGNNEVNLNKK